MSDETLTTREEVFGPVVALYRFRTEEEVITRANDCEVGLGAFIVTENMSRTWRVAEALEVGMVGVNLGMLSACESPFGGKDDRSVCGNCIQRPSIDLKNRRQTIRIRKRRWTAGN